MKATVTIPEQSREPEVLEFRVNPGSPNVNVIMVDPIKGRITKTVNITTEWQAATATQRNTIKAFFKKIGVAALDDAMDVEGVAVTTNEVTGDLFDGVPES